MSRAFELSTKYKTVLDKGGINTPRRLAHFWAQMDHESNLVSKRESLYYTKVANARGAFYTPFKGKSDTFVTGYLKDSVKMANYVYANRMGNGDVKSGEGFKYRGGGFLQHTGKDEYRILEARLGIDFVANPDLILEEPNAILAAIDGWNRRGLSRYADLDDIDTISDIINIGRSTKIYGDANGFADRLKKYKAYKIEFKA